MATTATKKTKTTTAATKEKTEEVVETKKIVPKEIDQYEMIVVRNGFQGTLIYISPRTNEKYVWEKFGDELEIELRELRNIKNSTKAFYENNWFMFPEEYSWVVDYLGLNVYYKNALQIEDFDEIFNKSPEEVQKIVENLSAGQKKSLSYKARLMIAEDKIDSLKLIDVLEKSLGVALVER